MFRKYFAGFLATIFIMVSVPLVFLMGLYDTLKDRDFYTGELVDHGYEIFLDTFAEFLIEQKVVNLSEQELKKVAGDVFSKDDLRGAVGQIYDDVNAATLDDGKLNIVFSLDWLLDKKDVFAAEIADLMFEKLPETGTSKIDFQLELSKELENKFFVDVPKDFKLTINVPDDVEGKLTDYFADLFVLFFAGVGGFLIFLLVFGAILIFRPWHQVLKFEVKTVFFAGLLLTISMTLLFFSPQLFETDFFKAMVIDLDELQFNAYINFMIPLLRGVSSTLLVYSVPVSVMALAGWIALHGYVKKEL